VREVLDKEIGILLLERCSRVRSTGSENSGTGSFSRSDTGGSILNDKSWMSVDHLEWRYFRLTFERRSVTSGSTEEVRVGEGLSSGNRVGGNENVGDGKSSNRDSLSSVEVGS
jgi:hypothetical protein